MLFAMAFNHDCYADSSEIYNWPAQTSLSTIDSYIPFDTSTCHLNRFSPKMPPYLFLFKSYQQMVPSTSRLSQNLEITLTFLIFHIGPLVSHDISVLTLS
jgi:hypothetical protein